MAKNSGPAITPSEDPSNPPLPPQDSPPGVPFEQHGDVNLTKRKEKQKGFQPKE